MFQNSAAIALIVAVAFVYPSTSRGALGESNQLTKEKSAKKKAVPQSSLTGCVDQQEGHYLLVDDRSLAPIADLVADGFPTEGFAKHVGHKVTVRGTSSSEGARPVMAVRSIDPVSDTCAPQRPQQGKV